MEMKSAHQESDSLLAAEIICSCTLGGKVIRFILPFQYCMGQIKCSL